MMPKSVAEKIKNGASAVETCEVFEMVTIVFNDIPMFGDICKNCDGMQIVGMLNQMFGMFDVLSDKNKVYKVETVKDCFVGVAGAPERAKNHAELIMDMAMDMRDSVCFVKDPRYLQNTNANTKKKFTPGRGRTPTSRSGLVHTPVRWSVGLWATSAPGICK